MSDAACTLPGLPIVAIMQPLNALVFVWDGVFMGAERFSNLAGTMVLAAALTLAGLGVAWLLEAGLLGIWLCMVLLIATRGFTQALRYFGRATILPRGAVQ